MSETPRERLFGRRKGRPLRAGRMRLMETLLPHVRLELAPERQLDTQETFGPNLRELWMEIGFGGGEHLAAQAQNHPEIGFIGCEPFVNGVAALLVHIETHALKNVRVYPNDARHVLDALPDGALTRCFVLFADPWPKKRHAERRFIGKDNLDRLARVLAPGGALVLATDVPVLAAWMREQTSAHAAFSCIYDDSVPPPEWVQTRYERKALAAGRTATYMTCLKTAPDPMLTKTKR